MKTDFRQHYHDANRIERRRAAAVDLLGVLIFAAAVFAPFYLWSM